MDGMTECPKAVYNGEHQWRGLYILYGWRNPYTEKHRTARFRVGRVCDNCNESQVKSDWHSVWLVYKAMQEKA